MRRTMTLAATVLLVTGCGSTSGGTPTAGSAGAPTTAAALSANAVGPKGSACEMPVTFEVSKGWKPKQVTIAADHPLAELNREGPFTAVCEIDAKPAGMIGFIRVYTGKAGSTPKEAIEAFIAASKESQNPVFTEFTVNGKPAVDVRYEKYSKLLEETRKQAAFAVQTPAGAIVVHLGGIDTEGHDEMLPAYELAKKSLVLGG